MTNAVLNLCVLVVLGVVFGPRLRGLHRGPLAWTALVMIVMTMVFDSVMIGIGLCAYAPDKILGVYVIGAPIEDFAYALAALVLMPALWTMLGERSQRSVAAPTDRADAES